MSDRGDFFESASKSATAPKSLPTRGDFFAGNLMVDDDTATVDNRRGFKGGLYEKIGDTLLNAPETIATAFNRGVADLAGLPMTVSTQASNLLGAGYGTGMSMLTGKPAGEYFMPDEPGDVPGTGDWFAQQLDSTPLGNVTQLPHPEDPGSRLLYSAAAGIPSAIVGGGPRVPMALSSAAGGTASAITAEAGGDPAMQATAAMLAGRFAVPSPQMSPLERMRPDAEPVPTAKPTTQELLNQSASKQSMGAAGASVDLKKLSPPLKQAVEEAVLKKGGTVNPEVLAREVQADSLPVRVNLSEGQKLGDPRLISEERNARGAMAGYVEGFAAQNKALTENLRAFRDTAGENVFSTSAVEHGDTLIARYQAIDEARNAEIGTKYQALRDAAGGEFPVDTQSLLTNVRAALKKDLATSKAPSDVMALLEERAAAGSMTLEDFEALRTSLSRTQRSASDGQERHAAGVIRNQIEAMPLQAGAEQLKDLADAARAAARERFQALEADPAYKAAVNETTPPDKFVQKFVINGTRDNVARMSDTMKGDETAAQTLKVATLDHLRQAAGIDGSYNGNFSQAGFNKALRALEPKIGSLLDPQLAEHVQNLGDVARYSQLQPEGHFVNNSNTFTALAAHGADALEGVANVKAGGLPVGTLIRKHITDRKGRKAAAKTFAPGSGLTRLSDLTDVGKEKK